MKINSQKIYDDFKWCKVNFECGDGWLPLIHGAFSEIDNYCEENKIDNPSVLQVKEKYGSLRIYLGVFENTFAIHVSNIMKIIERYELASMRYCQLCGKGIDERSKVNHYGVCEECIDKLNFVKSNFNIETEDLSSELDTSSVSEFIESSIKSSIEATIKSPTWHTFDIRGIDFRGNK